MAGVTKPIRTRRLRSSVTALTLARSPLCSRLISRIGNFTPALKAGLDLLMPRRDDPTQWGLVLQRIVTSKGRVTVSCAVTCSLLTDYVAS